MIRRLEMLFALLYRRDKQWLLAILCAMLVSSILEVVSIGSVPVLITMIANPDQLRDMPFVGQFTSMFEDVPKPRLVVWGGVMFLLVFLARTLIVVLTRYMQLHYSATRQVRITSELFDAYLRAPYMFHLNHNSSELVRNIQVGAMRMGAQIINQLLAGTQSLLLLIGILVLLLSIDPMVTLVSCIIFGIFGGVFIRLTSSRSRALGEQEMKERKHSLQIMKQSLEGIREIQLAGKTTYFVQQFRRHMFDVAAAQRDSQLLSYLSGPLMEALAIITLMAIAFMTLAFGRSLSETASVLGLFAVAFIRIRGSLATVLGTYTNLNYSLASIDPIHQGLTQLGRAKQPVSRKKPLSFESQIEFREVTLRYSPRHEPVLNRVSFSIGKGEYLGVVGTTGSGKSTLVGVLTGILRPNEGKVLIDGKNIQEHITSWQGGIGYVPQELFLLDDSIRRNIALGVKDSEIDEYRLKDALEKAQLLDFIDSLPKGLETKVGERGLKVSGGQRQRIGIARALYRSPKILVLDEATAALDGKTEYEFLKAIRMLKSTLTIVSIAHRYTTLRDCDKIVMIESGCIKKMRLENGEPIVESKIDRNMGHIVN